MKFGTGNFRGRRTRMTTRAKKSGSRGAAGLKFDTELIGRLKDSLAEDVGSGDVTALATVPARMRGVGRIYAKAEGVLCGAPVADRIWQMQSRAVKVDWQAAEGSRVKPGQIVAELSGPYRGMITGERVALNFLQRMSGVATLTRRIVDLAEAGAGEAAPDICDTRKTTPLWRKLERYAVAAGGGKNHRFGLYDAAMIKENHVRVAGGIRRAVEQVRSQSKVRIIVEVQNEAELAEAVELGIDIVLLDNMKPAQIKKLVKRYRTGEIEFEISGGVTENNMKAYANTGADRISLGALTHSAIALDLSLQLFPEGQANWRETGISS